MLSRSTAVAASASEDVNAEVHLELDPETESYEEEEIETHERIESVEDSTAEQILYANPDEPFCDFSVVDLIADAGAGTGKEESENQPDGPASEASQPIDAMSDEELLEGIRSQSDAHFAELYDRYFQRIYSFVYRRMRNHAETEEVVQETFLAVFRSFERYRGQSSLLSWIYGIAKNTANSCIRHAISQTERIDLADEEDLIPRPSLDVGAPDEQLDFRRFQDKLTLRLDGLADWQVEIFEMRHFENLSITEISKRTARSSDAVRSSLYRVKRIFFEAVQATGAHVEMTGEPS